MPRCFVRPMPESFSTTMRRAKTDNGLCITTTDGRCPSVAWHDCEPGIGLRESARLSQIPYRHDDSLCPRKYFPTGKLDADLQQVDCARRTAGVCELERSHCGNARGPTGQFRCPLCALQTGWTSLMRRDHTRQKHIVNCNAWKASSFRFKKAPGIPIRTWQKRLNMMTPPRPRSGHDGIYMTAVDTGWVTDEDRRNFPSQAAIA